MYSPSPKMTAKDISDATKGVWAESAVIEKLEIVEKTIPDAEDGTQEKGVKAALDCLESTKVDYEEIDVILCMGKEYKDYL